MARIGTGEMKKGVFIRFRSEPYQIVSQSHINPGRGMAYLRTKLKSVRSGNVLEATFKNSDSVEVLTVTTHDMQYLYHDGDGYAFMDGKSFEQYTIATPVIGEGRAYLKEGETYQVLLLEGKAVGMRFPKKVMLTVTESADGAKGNTATAATKTVTVETGKKLQVPLFIKTGDTLVINTETGEYIERG